MKKIITLIFLLGITNYGNAQFLENLKKEIKKSAEDAVTKKTKKETDKKVDKTLDKVLNPKLNKKNKTDEEKIDSAFNEAEDMDFNMAGKSESSYTFDMKAHTRIVSYKKRKSDTNLMEFLYGKNANGTTVSDPGMTIITDWKNESSIMLDETQKTARVISLSFLKSLKLPKSNDSDSEDEGDVKVEKTGKTKTLNGYVCHQYVATSKKSKMELWFAPELKYSFESTAANLSKFIGNEASGVPSNSGYLMEMINYEKGKLQSHLLVTKLELTPITISLSNYTIQ